MAKQSNAAKAAAKAAAAEAEKVEAPVIETVAETPLAEDPPADVVAEVPPVVVQQDGLPALDLYISNHEAKAQESGQVVTRIAYPGAEGRVHPGVYSGIVIIDGELSATYSDGSKH